ncbi:hypothetical protein HPP92_008152 [Vanilla planifolia]|uniref:Uncharacterized protein n=1 Tax=Vanilla planifolia TaxID=51239 RepID=A0A835RHH6_VANPL|nr:hypothetical protein HPP92_008152 [Vanilla planifolia]
MEMWVQGFHTPIFVDNKAIRKSSLLELSEQRSLWDGPRDMSSAKAEAELQSLGFLIITIQ